MRQETNSPGASCLWVPIERPEFANHKVITVSCPNLDVGDVMIPMPNRERGCVEMLPNELFAPACEEPCIIVLDEFPYLCEATKGLPSSPSTSARARLAASAPWLAQTPGAITANAVAPLVETRGYLLVRGIPVVHLDWDGGAWLLGDRQP